MANSRRNFLVGSGAAISSLLLPHSTFGENPNTSEFGPDENIFLIGDFQPVYGGPHCQDH